MKPISDVKSRLAVMLFYVCALLIANGIAFRTWLPVPNETSLWIVAGILNVLLGSFLVTPYFERPANHIASSVVAFVACWLSFDWSVLHDADRFIAKGILTYLALVATISGAAIVLSRNPSLLWSRISVTCKVIADSFGNDRLLFSVVIIGAVILFHRDDALQVLVILSTLIVVVLLRPENYLISFAIRMRDIWHGKDKIQVVGEIAGFDEPGIVLIRQPDKSVTFGDYILVNDPGTRTRICQVIGYFGRDTGMLLRAKLVDLPNEALPIMEKLTGLTPSGTAASIHPTGALKDLLLEDLYVQRSKDLVGLVSENTSIHRLFVEVVQEAGVSEGSVLEASIRGEAVLYQITEGLTKEEAVFQRNTRGFIRAEARKIGRWNAGQSKFSLVRWIPEMHAPVFLAAGPRQALDETAIGNLPSTTYPVGLRNIHELVTHNCAILGILGVGKSFLAIELIERMFAEDIKVVCLDLTNQYAVELEEFYDSVAEDKCIARIQAAADQDRENVEDSRSKGGSIENFRKAIHDDLASFISGESGSRLKIYNPSQLNASIQAGEIRNRKIGPGNNDWAQVAAFRETTPAEVTRIVTECCLALTQDQMRDKAKVCIVFEEAHSLVPEYNNLTVDGDKHAVAGTARAILQGRKYGMGCLLISQRTANVTKTILNQCNTVFAFRTFDDTGMAFLENYLGSDYAHVLPSLEERHVVFFGKASSSENPVLMRVNDREDFKARFRAVHPIKRSEEGA